VVPVQTEGYAIFVSRAKGRDYLKFKGVDWKIVNKLTLKKYTVTMRLKFLGLV
jgi:hypothetical protein